MLFVFMKESNYFYKLIYEEYLELTRRCLLNNKYIKLTRLKISFREITHVYEKTHVTIV
jgi:hypothetical protein